MSCEGGNRMEKLFAGLYKQWKAGEHVFPALKMAFNLTLL